ncbi:MAG: hypothetical protein HUU16_00070 [Candidatus Omnitrophica bacterium]|nr:hypothetical protein [Candidatus Omnitrophota bacterium]
MDTSVDWKIPGGIEPGEAGTVTLDMNIFSEWSKIPDRGDYFLDLFAILILDSYGEEVPIDLQFAEGRL